jgi:hypothetical protein
VLDGSTTGFYGMFDDLRDVVGVGNDVTAMAGMKEVELRQWLACYQTEVSSFSSVSIYAEVKLKEAMRMDANNRPSTFRTGVCGDLFYKVVGLFGRYSELMRTIGGEMCASIYADYAPGKSPFEMTPFFVANQQMQKQACFPTEGSECQSPTSVNSDACPRRTAGGGAARGGGRPQRHHALLRPLRPEG